MRRFTFYFIVALISFGIGSIVVFEYYWNTHIDLPQISLTQDSKVEAINNPLEYNKIRQAEFVEIAFKDFPCEDENLTPSWSEFKDRTVSINTDYIERIKDCSDLIEIDYLVDSNNDGQVDLNNNGQMEIFVRSHVGYFCGNNCQIFWVFEKDKEKRLRKLFEQKGYITIVENRMTNGYKDIRFEVYITYDYFDKRLYKFDGTKYVPKSVGRNPNYL